MFRPKGQSLVCSLVPQNTSSGLDFEMPEGDTSFQNLMFLVQVSNTEKLHATERVRRDKRKRAKLRLSNSREVYTAMVPEKIYGPDL